MKDFVKQNASMVAWGLSIAVVALSIYVWGDQLNWKFSSLNNYRIFPLLGLLAFSLMWSHYIMGALRVWSGFEAKQISSYRKYTHYAVLVAIILHPALIIYQLNSDGLGLPPSSYANYVGEAAVKFVYLGVIAWIAFILFEFKNKLSSKPWWKYVLMFNALAMLMIVVHALQLGSHLQTGWYKTVFIGYALTLIASYVYLFNKKQLF